MVRGRRQLREKNADVRMIAPPPSKGPERAVDVIASCAAAILATLDAAI